MKFIARALIVTVVLSLATACGKKSMAPGSAPVASSNAPTKQGVKPSGNSDVIVQAETAAGKPKNRVSLIDGGWESDCKTTYYQVDPNDGESAIYESYRVYITVGSGGLFEQLFYFRGSACGSYSDSIESGQGDLWFFDVLEDGAVNGAPMVVNYTDYNMESTGGFEGKIYIKETNGKQTVRFDNYDLIFSRDK